MRCFFLLVIVYSFVSCKEPSKHHLFSNVTFESGVAFSNDLKYTESLNPYTYRNFYNGAGVAVGDINNDGLLDIYFAGNQVNNKLYLNTGNFLFKDITDSAGVSCPNVWSTGVTFVDINSDKLLDIYVCKSGDPNSPIRHNELFINNGDLTFTERSKEFGLDVTGLSVQAAFFDYDKDGDLDCYLLTNSFKSVGVFDFKKNQREVPDPLGGGNKFFINEDGKFKDISNEVGIYQSNIGFGLGITLGDFNDDSWVDIFVSNDFFERDYLYINNQKGAFKESLPEYFESISMGSMGADFADLDNDGFSELFVTEMLPDSLARRKTKTVFETWDKHMLNVANGYHYQFSRNTLQKRIAQNHFAEIGRMSGVAASEWSWGALLLDVDNDGLRDIFIANGIYKDLLDRDYLTYAGAEENIRKMIRTNEKDVIIKLIDQMPTSEYSNYAYQNMGGLRFINRSKEWGLDEPLFSSGSAYGDFDNDGDLDLVVNNINSSAALYKNNSDTLKVNSITVSLISDDGNTFQVGARVKVYCGSQIFTSDNFMSRGFQSSVSHKMHFGLGSITKIDSIVIQWPDFGFSSVFNPPINREVAINKSLIDVRKGVRSKGFENSIHLIPVQGITFKHNGSGLNDFNRDRLLPFMYSNETPSFAKGDIDNDGNSELYMDGGKDYAGIFFTYSKSEIKGISFEHELNRAEETKSTFLDVDGDGDLDLYISSGGRFYSKSSSLLQDIIFINDGKGNFSESKYRLPFTDFVSTSVAKPLDFDNDGDMDLFIGERFNPFYYGTGGRGYLFSNDGNGKFSDVTNLHAKSLLDIGMVTDAVCSDIDNDGFVDIAVVGDWAGIVILKNEKAFFRDISDSLGLHNTNGWWHAIESNDFNLDGKLDFVVGNQGYNSFFKEGDRMYVSDFDENGSVEQIFCTKVNNRYYPLIDKDDLISQIPSLKKQLIYYKDYSVKSIDMLFSSSILSKAKVFEVDKLSSVVLLSGEKGYSIVELPGEAQFSPIYAMTIKDFDDDGISDLVVGGNQYQIKPQFGRSDASSGWFFRGELKNKNFNFIKGVSLNVRGQIRDIECIEFDGINYLFFAKHNDYVEIFRWDK